MADWKEEVAGLAGRMAGAPQIAPEEIPDIDLYMDQLTTYLDKRLGFYSREEGSPFVTGAMVNNYSKAKLLPAPVHKRYGKIHVMLLSLVCQLKRILTIQDLGRLLAPMQEEKDAAGLYGDFLEAQREAFAKTPAEAEELVKGLDRFPPEDGARAKAVLAVRLAARAQRDVMLAERILDTLAPGEEPGKRGARGKK